MSHFIKISGIYIITCKINNKHYIGESINVFNRLQTHKVSLKHHYHPNLHLQKSVDKYGIKNFTFELLEEYPHEVLKSMENYWCNLLDTHNNKHGYNKLPTGPFGHTTHSIETREKLSRSLKGNGLGIKRGPLSEETKLKIGLANKGNQYGKGRHHSQEAIEKLREIHKGKIYHPPIKHTESTKKYLSELKKGIPKSDQHKAKLSKIRSESSKYAIVQLDKNLNFIREWYSCRTCEKELNIPSSLMSGMINGKYQQIRGFVFIKKDDYENGNLPKPPSFSRTRRQVIKIDKLTGDVIDIFSSVRDAAKSINSGESYMGQICIHEKYYKGFIWKYKM